MEALHIPGTEITPLIEFDPADTILMIEGKMLPGNVEELFTPINNWVDAYFKQAELLNVLFRLYYYNTSSFKRIYMLCKKLNTYHEKGKKIKVRWEYAEGDDYAKRDAEDILEDFTYPYELVAVNE
jgi:hypothetical protein